MGAWNPPTDLSQIKTAKARALAALKASGVPMTERQISKVTGDTTLTMGARLIEMVNDGVLQRILYRRLAYPWERWHMQRNGGPRVWTEAMKDTGGDWRNWYVRESDIPLGQVVEVRRLDTDEVIYPLAAPSDGLVTLLDEIRGELSGKTYRKFVAGTGWAVETFK
jgi:hypothetical protein